MAPLSTRPNYKSERGPNSPASTQVPGRPDAIGMIEECLQLLARAVRQFHTYPATSPLCTEAVAACHKVFASLDRHDRLMIRVTPTELIVDEVSLGAGTIIEQELVRRLHRARVVGLDIDRIPSERHLSHFCSSLIRGAELADTKTTFAELLAEQGVDTILPLMAHRPEVLDMGAPAAAVCDLVVHEQRRRRATFATGGPVDYLYPPDKGWVRVDPSTRLDNVSLVDLALLVDNPADVASMLLRLTDDDAVGAEERSSALERKFSDVTTLFAALEPRLARMMFAKLARAVLELEPDRRKNLLRRTVLPGLLDGRADGNILVDFPDADLADSLCLLLELETAAPEVLTAALNRLDLSAERRQSVVPLIDSRLKNGGTGEGAAEREVERLARRLIRVDPAAGKDFSEFSAFDLSIDEQAASAIAAVGGDIDATDHPCTKLRLLARLVHLEPNPGLVDAFLRQAMSLFGELERADRWPDVVEWASQFGHLARELRENRPDVSDAIVRALTTFQTPARVAAVTDLFISGADERRFANALVEAFGVAIVPGLVSLLDDPGQQSRGVAAVSLMCDHATLMAPSLVPSLGRVTPAATRAIIKVLGFAGAGYEGTIGDQFKTADEQLAREALRALARIGTTHAAALVAQQIQTGSAAVRTVAEEALWRFQPARAAFQVRQLLGDRNFVMHHPDAASRLLARAANAGTDGLERVLAELEPLRFYFWNPGAVRVALKARELRVR